MVKLLIIAPHPDDELINCGGKIIKASKKDVFVVYVTSGAKAGDIVLRDRRENAVKSILSKRGVPVKNLFFLRFADSGTEECFGAVVRKLQSVISRVRPGEIYVPALEFGHVDHDVSSQALSGCKYRADVFEYPTYNSRIISLRKFVAVVARELRRLFGRGYFNYYKDFVPVEDRVPFFIRMSEDELREKNCMVGEYLLLVSGKKYCTKYGRDLFRRIK